MRTSLSHIFSIANKEAKHIKRDPFTLAVALILPLVFVWFFGFVINLDYHNIPLSVRDNDQSQTSRELLVQASSADYFDIKAVHTPLEADKVLKTNSMKGLLILLGMTLAEDLGGVYDMERLMNKALKILRGNF